MQQQKKPGHQKIKGGEKESKIFYTIIKYTKMDGFYIKKKKNRI